jgi:hypothetical protein
VTNESESDQIKEVYTQFGLVMYQVQCFERTLAILLITAYVPDLQRITRAQYEELLGRYFQRTLGNLINQLREFVTIPRQLETILSRALQKRNWLVHHYFWERGITFMKEDGRESMIRELREIAQFFEGIDLRLTKIVEKWTRKQGITEETIQRRIQKLIDSE